MKEKTAELKEKIEKDYKDMMAVINSTSLPLFVEDTIEDMHILIKTLIAENKELKEKIKEINEEYNAEQKHEMENTIPKSKVEEIIKELDKTDSKISKSLFNDDCGTWTKAIQNLLKRELLEE